MFLGLFGSAASAKYRAHDKLDDENMTSTDIPPVNVYITMENHNFEWENSFNVDRAISITKC